MKENQHYTPGDDRQRTRIDGFMPRCAVRVTVMQVIGGALDGTPVVGLLYEDADGEQQHVIMPREEARRLANRLRRALKDSE